MDHSAQIIQQFFKENISEARYRSLPSAKILSQTHIYQELMKCWTEGNVIRYDHNLLKNIFQEESDEGVTLVDGEALKDLIKDGNNLNKFRPGLKPVSMNFDPFICHYKLTKMNF